MEKLKIGKTYKINGKKFKVLSLKSTHKGSMYGGGGYTYKVKYFAHMNCVVEYYNGHFEYYATAY